MMKKTREFDNILDECLERVLTGGETVEQCLARYPDDAIELEPLLRTALFAREATAIKPRLEFRDRARYQFQQAIRDLEAPKNRWFFGWQPQWATAVIVVIVLLLAGSSTVAAASDSMPDEPLYQVKLATEVVRLTLTPSALGKAELYVKLADKRIDEIIKMADKGKTEQVERATQRLNSQLIAMASLPVPGKEEPMEAEITKFGLEPPPMAAQEAPAPLAVEEPQRAPLKEVAPSPEAAPAPPPQEEVPVLGAPRATGPPEDTGPDSGLGKGGEKAAKPDKQAQLKQDLSRRAIQNQDALREVLDRVPESVKPAIRRAIEAAGVGYEQAIRNFE